MPAIDLTQGPTTLSRYDVVGVHVEDQRHFVMHVALHDDDSRSVEAGGNARVVHMGPPLSGGETIKVDVAGHVPLTNDEVKKVSTWIKKIADEYPRWPQEQFVIHPPWKDERDGNTDVRRYRRYSCAGFVLDSHRKVKIDLLEIDEDGLAIAEDSLPEVDKQTIMSAYPDVERHARHLPDWGLEGAGPWKVVLAGYVLHALNRPEDEIRREPYKAKGGDEKF